MTNTIARDAILQGTRGCSPRVIANQIGIATVLSISGGRVTPVVGLDGIEHVGIDLPVSSGYHVIVVCQADDTYRVHRVLKRGPRLFDHGQVAGVYCDQLAEVAYQAGMFRSFDFGEEVAV